MSMADNTLLASELIVELQKAIEQYGDLPVQTEGCDCDGNAQCVEMQYPGAGILTIGRMDLDRFPIVKGGTHADTDAGPASD